MNEDKITVTKSGDSVTVNIKGSFDSTTTPLLNGHCERIARDKAIKTITLDFQDVTNIDSSAFACVVGFMNAHLKEGVVVYLKDLKDTHKGYIDMLKLGKIIKII